MNGNDNDTDSGIFNWNLFNMATFIRINLFVKIVLMEWLNRPFYKKTDLKINNKSNFYVVRMGGFIFICSIKHLYNSK